MSIIHTIPSPKWPKPLMEGCAMKQFKKCSILKETNTHYSDSSDKLCNILPFGEMDRTDGKYTHGDIMPITDEDKARDREEIKIYVENKEIAFKLICSCGNVIRGIVGGKYDSDKLHCDCGLVWKVNKPYREDDK